MNHRKVKVLVSWNRIRIMQRGEKLTQCLICGSRRECSHDSMTQKEYRYYCHWGQSANSHMIPNMKE